MRPPDNSQNLHLELDEGRLSLMAARARSTISRGTPESGTGTAIHSDLQRLFAASSPFNQLLFNA